MPLASRNGSPSIIGWILLAGLLWLGAGCSGGEDSPSSAGLPHVILITLDSLRADHLGCYGYERDTSLRLDALAAQADFYPRALSSSSWTVPSHASLFTGLHPFEHGAHSYEVSQPNTNNVSPLDGRHRTLAEILRDLGYRTGAIAANSAYLNHTWGMQRGFATYDVERRLADRLNEAAFAWLAADDGRPQFLFLNYMDTHRPYNTTPRPGFLPEPAVQDRGELLERLIEAVLPAEGPVPVDLAQQVIDQYDTGIANLDEHIGRFLDHLQELGIYDRTLLVVTSDHGEYFGEHHLVEHSKDVYQPVLAVPLMIKRPGQRRGRVVETLTTSADIPLLILDLLGEDLAERLRPVLGDTLGPREILCENYFTRSRDLFHPVWGSRFQHVRTALFRWPFKFIRSSDGRHELFDLASDPAETRNLITDRPALARSLASRLEEYQAGRRRAPASPELPELSDQERNRLRALGYLAD